MRTVDPLALRIKTPDPFTPSHSDDDGVAVELPPPRISDRVLRCQCLSLKIQSSLDFSRLERNLPAADPARGRFRAVDFTSLGFSPGFANSKKWDEGD
jgi:hypothetical protein